MEHSLLRAVDVVVVFIACSLTDHERLGFEVDEGASSKAAVSCAVTELLPISVVDIAIALVPCVAGCTVSTK